MRKIIAIEYLSLDGFVAGVNGETDWFSWNEEVDQYYIDFQSGVDTVLFGRATYDTMFDYWATSKAAEENKAITNFMNDTKKFVFSKTLKKADWNNTELLTEIIPEKIIEIKNQANKDLAIYGSGSIVSQLAVSNLIDEYRIFINPVALGNGRPLFKNLRDRISLEPFETKLFECGVVLLRYRSKNNHQ